MSSNMGPSQYVQGIVLYPDRFSTLESGYETSTRGMYYRNLTYNMLPHHKKKKNTKHLPCPYLLGVVLPSRILFLLLLRVGHLDPLDLPDHLHETPDHLHETHDHLPETPDHLPETHDHLLGTLGHQAAAGSPVSQISVGC